jgi:hypothetical protein
MHKIMYFIIFFIKNIKKNSFYNEISAIQVFEVSKSCNPGWNRTRARVTTFTNHRKLRDGLKTRRRKTGRANSDIFLDITFLLLELFFNLN